MRKQEFLDKLKSSLSALPLSETNEQLEFYSEMIDDLIEDGVSEEDAVSKIGSVEDIALKILSDSSSQGAKKKSVTPKKRISAFEIVLIVLGFPLWLPLLIVAFAIVFSLYAVLWSLVISLWAIFASSAALVPYGIISGFANLGNTAFGFAYIGLALICAGTAIFLFFGCKSATKGTVILAKRFYGIIKGLFVSKEAVQ